MSLGELGEWTLRAKCRDMEDVLFPESKDQRRVRNICMSCPVRMECLAEALDSRVQWGVWGGMTERERRRLPCDRRQLVAPQGVGIEGQVVDLGHLGLSDPGREGRGDLQLGGGQGSRLTRVDAVRRRVTKQQIGRHEVKCVMPQRQAFHHRAPWRNLWFAFLLLVVWQCFPDLGQSHLKTGE